METQQVFEIIIMVVGAALVWQSARKAIALHFWQKQQRSIAKAREQREPDKLELQVAVTGLDEFRDEIAEIEAAFERIAEKSAGIQPPEVPAQVSEAVKGRRMMRQAVLNAVLEGAKMNLHDVRRVLETTHRMGADIDEPEGVRYIQISDTLARLMATAIAESFPERGETLTRETVEAVSKEMVPL